jgi:hypothetical protein
MKRVTMLEALRDYAEKNGNCLVPHSLVVERGGQDLSLGGWVARQRVRFSRDTMPANEVEELNAIGFAWSRKVPWESWLAALNSYVEENGNAVVPYGFIIEIDGQRRNLGVWVKKQRERRQQGELSQSQVSSLDALGMVWRLRG